MADQQLLQLLNEWQNKLTEIEKVIYTQPGEVVETELRKFVEFIKQNPLPPDIDRRQIPQIIKQIST